MRPDAIVLIMALLPPPLVVHANSTEIWATTAMDKVFPWTQQPCPTAATTSLPTVVLDAARAEHVAFQLVVRRLIPPALNHISMEGSTLTRQRKEEDHDRAGPTISSAAFLPTRRVVCVNVTHSGSKSGMWPDPLPYLSASDNFLPNTTSALWVSLVVPPDAAPGKYTGTAVVRAAGILLARVPIALTVWSFSVAARSLRTDSKISQKLIEQFRDREPDGGANLTAIVLRYYEEMIQHRVTMMGWGGVSVFPSVRATFSADLSTVSLDTSGWDAMVAELEAMGLEQLHFPLPSPCGGGCCEPITHADTKAGQVIPPTATFYLSSGQPAVAVFDATAAALGNPVLNRTFVQGLTTYVRAMRAHLDAQGWLPAAHDPQPSSGRLSASYMMFVDEVDITDPWTARALLLINTLLKSLEPRLQMAQTRFPTSMHGAQNQTLVRQIEGVVDLWVASVDECHLHACFLPPYLHQSMVFELSRLIVSIS
jgi:hypothetical protein